MSSTIAPYTEGEWWSESNQMDWCACLLSFNFMTSVLYIFLATNLRRRLWNSLPGGLLFWLLPFWMFLNCFLVSRLSRSPSSTIRIPTRRGVVAEKNPPLLGPKLCTSWLVGRGPNHWANHSWDAALKSSSPYLNWRGSGNVEFISAGFFSLISPKKKKMSPIVLVTLTLYQTVSVTFLTSKTNPRICFLTGSTT